MTKLRTLLAAAVLSLTSATAAFAAHTHVPTPSTWNLNVKASDFGGGPALRSDVDMLVVDNDQHMHWIDVTVDGSGAKSKTSWEGPEDGTPSPIQGIPGSQFSWNTATDSEHIVFADGTIYDAVLTVPDGAKQMIFTQTIKQPDGKVFHQKLVYDRVK